MTAAVHEGFLVGLCRCVVIDLNVIVSGVIVLEIFGPGLNDPECVMLDFPAIL